MKSFIDEYSKIIMYTICGLLLVLSSYNILININHASFINQKVVVRNIDYEYKTYVDNVLKIEDTLLNKQEFQNILPYLKNNGAYKLMPGDKVGYERLYELNNYFIDVIINDVWISNLKLNNKYNTSFNNEYVNNLISNANYINKELLNNSNFSYDVRNNEVRNTIDEYYRFILNNYKSFSSLILELINN